MPAEWEIHEATWIAWPHNATDWPGKFHAISWVYADIVRKLSHIETVHILINDEAAEKRALSILARSGADPRRVRFHRVPNRPRMDQRFRPYLHQEIQRLRESHRCGYKLEFNAWAKYDNWRQDDLVPEKAAKALSLQEWKPTIHLNDGCEHRIVPRRRKHRR